MYMSTLKCLENNLDHKDQSCGEWSNFSYHSPNSPNDTDAQRDNRINIPFSLFIKIQLQAEAFMWI